MAPLETGARKGPRKGCTRIIESDEPELGEAGEELDARRAYLAILVLTR